MKKQTFTTTIEGKEFQAEISDLTEQAGGSVLLTCGDTVILVTAVMDEHSEKKPFLPLSVEFEERFYAAGAILGGRFQRREGRPSEEAILSARRIDRTIRPLFPEFFRQDIQIVVTVIAMGEEDPDVLGIIGSSIALSISPIPWNGPVGAVRIGHSFASKQDVINPTYSQRSDSDINVEIIACGQNRTINMIETSSEEADEMDILHILKTATKINAQLETWQNQIVETLGVEKVIFHTPEASDELIKIYNEKFSEKLEAELFSGVAGKKHLDALKRDFIITTEEANISSDISAGDFFHKQIDILLHKGVLEKGIRPDGRDMESVRPLFAQAGGVSPVLHGSGIFYRGGTHIFSALTLAPPSDALFVDTIESQEGSKRFMHHYNFPPFSVGETGRVGGFNRRMIGHGALAEQALTPVIPEIETFPYTIRLVSETMASNGSSSMGSVCASTLALLDGGVPIKRPVAGIASGVIIGTDGEYALLTDIQGPEDEYGDMDLKVAGTREGITAMQMDVKVDGVTIELLESALHSAKMARLRILDVIEKEIPSHREHISRNAPFIKIIKIKPEQIGLVIGGGGKTINGIKDKTEVKDIHIEDDGTIYITGAPNNVEQAKKAIEKLTKTYEIGDTFTATITSTTDFGAFASFDEGNSEGLIHISEISPKHTKKVTDVIKVGDKVPVIIIKNENGKIGLSIKATDPNFFDQ